MREKEKGTKEGRERGLRREGRDVMGERGRGEDGGRIEGVKISVMSYFISIMKE